MKLIDGIINEPLGGAHRHKGETMANVKSTLDKALKDLMPWDAKPLIQKRREKFLAFGRNL